MTFQAGCDVTMKASFRVFSPTAGSFGVSALALGWSGAAHQGSTKVLPGFHEVLRGLRGDASTKKRTACCWGYHLSLFFSFAKTRWASCIFLPKSCGKSGFRLPLCIPRESNWQSSGGEVTQRHALRKAPLARFLFFGVFELASMAAQFSNPDTSRFWFTGL